MLARRLSNKEIAISLNISTVTVKRHAANIYQKLGVHGR
ncbi:MAG: response regulator transcription factor [Pseudomonadales bacterium]